MGSVRQKTEVERGRDLVAAQPSDGLVWVASEAWQPLQQHHCHQKWQVLGPVEAEWHCLVVAAFAGCSVPELQHQPPLLVETQLIEVQEH